MSKRFWDSLGEILDVAVAEAAAASDVVVDHKFIYDDEDDSHMQVALTYKSGRNKLVNYVREDLIRPADVDTTPMDRNPRQCRTNTPADACEDRNCYYHRDVPGNQRSPLFYRF